MKKYIIFTIIFTLTNLCGINAQLIDDWQLLWPSKNNINPQTSFPNQLKAIDSLNIGFIFKTKSATGGTTGLILTSDGGKNWKESYIYNPKDSFRLFIHNWEYINKNFIYFLADLIVTHGFDNLGNEIIDYQAYIFKSTDNGNNWQKIQINDKWRSRTSTVLSMGDSLNGIMIQFPSKYEKSETNDQIWFTNDGWKTWNKIKSHPDMKASYQAIYEYPETIVTRTYGYQKIFITHNLGKSWTVKSIPDSIKSYNSPREYFKFFNKNIYYYIGNKLISDKVGFHTVIYKTTNAGDDWKILYNVIGWDMQVTNISIINDSTLYSSGKNPLYTSNNGKNWIKTNNAYLNNYEVYLSNRIEFSKTNKIAQGVAIMKYTGNKTLKPPLFTFPDSLNDLPLDFPLKWTPIKGASGYHLQIVERIGNPFDSLRPPPNFDIAKLFVNDSTLSGTSYQLTATTNYKEYTCRIRAFNDTLSSPWLSQIFWTSKTTSIKDNFVNKNSIVLFPNPSNYMDRCYLKFNLENNSNINISIFNNIGIKVSDIYNGYKEIGIHTIQYKPYANLPSGTYWLRMTINNKETIVKPVVIVR